MVSITTASAPGGGDGGGDADGGGDGGGDTVEVVDATPFKVYPGLTQ